MRAQDGSAATELTLLFPVVLLLVMLAIQFGLWFHARQVTQAAAEAALTATQAHGGTVAAGRTRAHELLTSAGGVRKPEVEVERSTDDATVSVRATVPAVVPGWDIGIDAHVVGEVERFVPREAR